MKHYDVVCVGAGIANIALAVRLMNTDKTVLLLDIGNPLEKRTCPKSTTGKCINCKHCQITTGFGGAGCFSDCKLTYSPYIGGNLIDYIGEDNFEKYLSEADNLFTRFCGSPDYYDDDDYSNKLQYECTKYGLKLLKGKVRHLGTDGSYLVMKNIWNALTASSNVTIQCNAEVENIDFQNKYVRFKYNGNDDSVSATFISVAVGRYGSEWLSQQCNKNGIKLINSTVDVGVRVECPRAITDKITDNMYEFKIVNHSSSDNAVRTFCVNPGGFVTEECYDNVDGTKLHCVNGHSNAGNESLTTNFALLVTSHFTEPFNQPIDYAKSIARMCNMLAGNKPMVQRLADLKNKKRSTKSRMERLCFTPTLKNAEPGDLRYALPSNILDSVVETLDKLNNIMPGMNGSEVILYGPEIKLYSSRIDVDSTLQSSKYNNVFFLGDSSGVTHGIIQSAMSGIYTADNILGK